LQRTVALLVAVALAGCATTVPYVGQGPHPQMERGQPVLPIDAIGNVFAVFGKILLWNWRFASHSVSSETEAYLVKYVDAHQKETGRTVFRLNQYAPHKDLKRLITNKQVAWPYRLLIGIPVTLIFDVVLPGRIFLWGDYYNPWTNTVHLYSDHPAISLHEAGHSYDIGHRRFKGTYAFIRTIPFVDLYQEAQATDEAITHFIEIGDRHQEYRAYKILYPAMGTYAGSYMFIVGGSVIGAIVGHIFGRAKAHDRRKYYEQLDAQKEAASSLTPHTATRGVAPAIGAPVTSAAH